MKETKQTSSTGENSQEENENVETTMDQRQQQLVDMGSSHAYHCGAGRGAPDPAAQHQKHQI